MTKNKIGKSVLGYDPKVSKLAQEIKERFSPTTLPRIKQKDKSRLEPMPYEVFQAISAVRESGVINMLDVNGVAKILIEMGEYKSANWVLAHKKSYASLIFMGPEKYLAKCMEEAE